LVIRAANHLQDIFMVKKEALNYYVEAYLNYSASKTRVNAMGEHILTKTNDCDPIDDFDELEPSACWDAAEGNCSQILRHP